MSTIIENISLRTSNFMQEISSRIRNFMQDLLSRTTNYIQNNSFFDPNGSIIIVLLTVIVIFMIFFGILLTNIINNKHTDSEDNCLKYHSCKNKKLHTMCKFPVPVAGSACNRLDSSGISKSEKNGILRAHNDYRKTIENELRQQNTKKSTGIYIPPILWDDDLAAIALRWAIQCQFKHDECRNTEIYRSEQNLAIKTDYKKYEKSFGAAIKGWNEEFANKTHESLLKTTNVLDTGDFTQKRWSQRTHVGCGIARYFDKKYYQTYIVCNYGRAINKKNHSVSIIFKTVTYIPFTILYIIIHY